MFVSCSPQPCPFVFCSLHTCCLSRVRHTHAHPCSCLGCIRPGGYPCLSMCCMGKHVDLASLVRNALTARRLAFALSLHLVLHFLATCVPSRRGVNYLLCYSCHHGKRLGCFWCTGALVRGTGPWLTTSETSCALTTPTLSLPSVFAPTMPCRAHHVAAIGTTNTAARGFGVRHTTKALCVVGFYH